MVKENSIIAIGANNRRPDYDYADQVSYHVFELKEGVPASTVIYSVDNEIISGLEVMKEAGQIRIVNHNPIKDYTIVLRNIVKAECKEANVVVTEIGVKIEAKAGTYQVQLKIY